MFETWSIVGRWMRDAVRVKGRLRVRVRSSVRALNQGHTFQLRPNHDRSYQVGLRPGLVLT